MSKKNKVMHLSSNSGLYPNKFVPDYSEFVMNNIKGSVHHFYYVGDGIGIEKHQKWRVYNNSFMSGIKLLICMCFYDLIVFHSIPSAKVTLILAFFIKYFKKCDLVVWGGEIHHQAVRKAGIRECLLPYFNKQFIKGCKGYITYIKEDFDYIKNNINPKAKWLDLGGFYPSNILKSSISNSYAEKVTDEAINILVGVSALKRNNHFEIIDTLGKSFSHECKIHIPLSYGDKEYAYQVEKYAKEILGEKNVYAIYEHVDYATYLDFLKTIDIAVFSHEGQQGMGNIRNLIGMGKTVYLNPKSVTWSYLYNLGFEIYDYKTMKDFDFYISEKNIEIARKEFSFESTLTTQIKYYTFN
ncbi:TDP-N-acetylfucosamine:lipid II N-acetylfucosaminyltransferase [Pseudoalteromonas sp. APC 3355]|uniref:TDP-N-acetylfucosamine:lipid II N-acetylfucosaminyltransferase n=1 Tax=Pseudoalteromonas sp. APC 3355 TaxID=3035199 RepID=UPI0025B506DB|nr:TDP-N-acetylfucosamine:lipid II N-acetylfucosaminyltransferase [Pseudoalteromonas sp. APC 3355]MDN3475546.1 TDP-N-acetylfucosamine:lipid II N-acetylfucosaminyltransferase [Pseudoalteromonas sp. APC 3355]